MSFLRFIAGDEVFDSAVVYPGDGAVRVTADGAGAGLALAGAYGGAAIALWSGSDQAACTLLSGVVRATFDPLASGGPEIVLSVTNGTTYAAAFKADIRSPAGGRTRRFVELQYVQGFGFWLAIDGVALTPATLTGTDAGIGASAGPIGLGCDIVAGLPVNTLRGGIAWFTLERSAGLPLADYRFDASVAETINPLLDSAWIGAGAAQYTDFVDEAGDLMLIPQDLSNNPLPQPLVVEVESPQDINVDFKIQNLTGANLSAFTYDFSPGISLRAGESIPAILGNNGRVTVRTVIDGSTMPGDYTVTINASGGNSVVVGIRADLATPPLGRSVTIISQSFPQTRII